MGNINSGKVPIEGNSINAGDFYCVPTDTAASTILLCAKAWLVPGKGYYAAAGIGDSNSDSITTFKAFKGNGAKTTEMYLEPGDVFVVSQVGPIKKALPWVVTDKSSVAGAIFEDLDQLLFADFLLYYFESDGVTVGYSGSVGYTGLWNQPLTATADETGVVAQQLTNQKLIV
jgi:hypothetical protein